MITGTAQSFGVLNYSGQIFDKANIDTPLVSMLPRRNTSSVEFVVNSTYASEDASMPKISNRVGSFGFIRIGKARNIHPETFLCGTLKGLHRAVRCIIFRLIR